MAKHHTFFGKIFGWIGDLFKEANKDFLELAVNITQKVKDGLNSPVVDLLTAIIPTNIDDELVKLLRKKMIVILADELLFFKLNEDSTDADVQEIATQIVDSFGGLTDEKKEEFYTSVAAKVYIFLQQVKSGKKITFGQGAALVESAYQYWLKAKKSE